MLRSILLFGVIAGLIVAAPMVLRLESLIPAQYGMLFGYAVMVVAFSTIFIAVKQHRDAALGGVIRFLPAFGIGLGISVIAGVFYTAAWEFVMAQAGPGMMDGYFDAPVTAARAKGVTGAALDELIRQAADMKASYANPIYRMATTFFVEIFPVGLIISLLAAVLLRNSRFLPARPTA